MNRRVLTTNNGALYIIAVVAIIIAFLLLGGWSWLQSLGHGNSSINIDNWNWAQILISLGIGFILGLLVSRRK
jgi:H+/Cl- antiporter ClcA